MITTEELIKLIKENPNNYELGEKLRTLYFKFRKHE
jgi:hypothetical protein